MKLPNFIIIGAAKSGTTALYYYLKQHPQIYMSPIKETNFFIFKDKKVDYCGPGDLDANKFCISDIEDYYQQFQGVTNEKAIGEASPFYIYKPEVPKLIKQYIANPKLIAILRNPVDRAYSSFLFQVRDCREELTDFLEALKDEDRRINNNWEPIWYYKNLGFYYTQLKRYYNIFSREQIKIYFYEDFTNNPICLMQDIFQFLGVDKSFVPNMSSKYNISGIPKNLFVQQLLKKKNPIKSILKPLIPLDLRLAISKTVENNNIIKPHLSPEIRSELTDIYREDILKLQELIQQDISHWLA